MNIRKYIRSNLITMNMKVSYVKNPAQNEARPHQKQVHLAPVVPPNVVLWPENEA